MPIVEISIVNLLTTKIVRHLALAAGHPSSGKGGKPAPWLSMLSILCHFHGLLFVRQVVEKPMCRHPVQYAALGARCSSAPHRLSLSASAIRPLIETTSQVIHLSELPVIQQLGGDIHRSE